MNRKTKGFTLVELLIYTAIVGSIFTSMIFITRTMYDVRARVGTSALVRDQVRFAMNRVIGTIQESTSVLVPINGTSSTLSLVTSIATSTPSVFRLSGGRIFLKEGTQAELPLTSNEIEITTFSVTSVSSTSAIIRVEIDGNKRGAKSPYSAPLSITNSATLRRE